MTNLIFLLAVSAVQAPASPPAVAAVPVQWELLIEQDGAAYSIDPASIVREGGIATARIRAVAPSASATGVRTLVVSARFDCAARTATTLAMEGFDDAGASLGTRDVPENERRAEPVGDAGADAAMMLRLCGAPRPAG